MTNQELIEILSGLNPTAEAEIFNSAISTAYRISSVSEHDIQSHDNDESYIAIHIAFEGNK